MLRKIWHYKDKIAYLWMSEFHYCIIWNKYQSSSTGGSWSSISFSTGGNLNNFNSNSIHIEGYHSKASTPLILRPDRILLGLFQFLCALNGIRLIFCPPLRNLTVGFGEWTLKFSLGFLFLFILLSEKVTVMAGRLKCMSEGILGLEGKGTFYKCKTNSLLL